MRGPAWRFGSSSEASVAAAWNRMPVRPRKQQRQPCRCPTPWPKPIVSSGVAQPRLLTCLTEIPAFKELADEFDEPRSLAGE